MKDQRGLVKEILIIIVLLVILGYFFNININTVLSSATVQANLAWFWNILVYIWSLISTPVTYLWNLFLSLLHAGVNSAAIQNATQSVASSTPL
jgi:hypothetical protein